MTWPAAVLLFLDPYICPSKFSLLWNYASRNIGVSFFVQRGEGNVPKFLLYKRTFKESPNEMISLSSYLDSRIVIDVSRMYLCFFRIGNVLHIICFQNFAIFKGPNPFFFKKKSTTIMT
jgi:hypothetical protein